ncbi:basic proline-rich protein-like [Pipistrellus kuhlii]|uniref:basic proline-rich protein-like n=1 Tax=Pipistrellus kuhlii TaxID=59472 RepID=UPI00174EF674|nr:basic proline-rich protein-like [Pipistrellus kuhlii]
MGSRRSPRSALRPPHLEAGTAAPAARWLVSEDGLGQHPPHGAGHTGHRQPEGLLSCLMGEVGGVSKAPARPPRPAPRCPRSASVLRPGRASPSPGKQVCERRPGSPRPAGSRCPAAGVLVPGGPVAGAWRLGARCPGAQGRGARCPAAGVRCNGARGPGTRRPGRGGGASRAAPPTAEGARAAGPPAARRPHSGAYRPPRSVRPEPRPPPPPERGDSDTVPEIQCVPGTTPSDRPGAPPAPGRRADSAENKAETGATAASRGPRGALHPSVRPSVLRATGGECPVAVGWRASSQPPPRARLPMATRGPGRAGPGGRSAPSAHTTPGGAGPAPPARPPTEEEPSPPPRPARIIVSAPPPPPRPRPPRIPTPIRPGKFRSFFRRLPRAARAPRRAASGVGSPPRVAAALPAAGRSPRGRRLRAGGRSRRAGGRPGRRRPGGARRPRAGGAYLSPGIRSAAGSAAAPPPGDRPRPGRGAPAGGEEAETIPPGGGEGAPWAPPIFTTLPARGAGARPGDTNNPLLPAVTPGGRK